MNVKDYVIQELESYPRTLRQIAVLRYELEHPVQVSTEEMLDAMAFARGEHFGSAPGHVSDKTLYIAMNYRQKANEVNAEISGEISAKLLELEHKKNRIEYYVGMLDSRKAEIYEQHLPLMERTATRILKEQSDSEDAVQNAFVQIIRHFDKIHKIPREELPFWIISIVKNEALSIIRKRQKTVSLENWDGYIIESENVLDYTELVNLFAKLPLSYRSVLEMKILLGYSDKEIATHLGISETAVSTRASRGRTLLREIIRKEGFSI